MNRAQAFEHLVEYCRALCEGTDYGKPTRYTSTYGYHVHLPHVARTWIGDLEGAEEHKALNELFPILADCAWELCCRGMLRPGIAKRDGQGTDDGRDGNGYSITSAGIKWFKSRDKTLVLVTDVDLFGKAMGKFGHRFGAGFIQRAEEAAGCFRCRCLLSCCVMCGAASESILLRLAIAKTKDEDRVLKDYKSAGGRERIKNLLLGSVTGTLRNQVEDTGLRLLTYWRDSSAHGLEVEISDVEALAAMTLLLRFCQIATDHWDDLTK